MDTIKSYRFAAVSGAILVLATLAASIVSGAHPADSQRSSHFGACSIFPRSPRRQMQCGPR